MDGVCFPYLTGLGADIIVNHSRSIYNQSGYIPIANNLESALKMLPGAHQKCLELLVPLLCRSIFVTCDPAYNTSVHQVYQPICRHGCDVVSLFACPIVWALLTSQRDTLQFGLLNSPNCEPLGHPNGGDAPDCIDTTDGGEYCKTYN